MGFRRAPGASPRGCREQALALLARTSRSRTELREALFRRGYPPAEVDPVLSSLVRSGLLDDRRAAEAFLASRRGRYGRARLMRELRARGFDREVADAALAGVERSDERETLRRLCRRKMAELSRLPAAERRRKVFASLARRGFASGEILEALRGRPDADEPDF